MINIIGFDREPEYTVLWLEDGKARFKTICYDFEEVERAVMLTEIEDSFHYKREYIIVNHQNKNKESIAI